ncbi:hypothetical protein B0H14DRAFT_2594925 [Mycena olivaceomarginata]|nr:hypothetical protein B0H14DRAFT_2594925 [Mycena olivaceomarginata]
MTLLITKLTTKHFTAFCVKFVLEDGSTDWFHGLHNLRSSGHILSSQLKWYWGGRWRPLWAFYLASFLTYSVNDPSNLPHFVETAFARVVHRLVPAFIEVYIAFWASSLARSSSSAKDLPKKRPLKHKPKESDDVEDDSGEEDGSDGEQ